MKKRFAALAMLMLLGCGSAFAEAADGAQAIPADEPTVSFDIRMDNIPEGYTYTTTEVGEELIAIFTPEDPEAVTVYVDVGHSADFEGFTFNRDLTEEETAQVTAYLTEDYSDPTLSILSTGHGTNYVLVEENNTDTDVADIITIWNGYVIWIGLQKNTDITQADLDLGGKILTDIWVTEKQ